MPFSRRILLVAAAIAVAIITQYAATANAKADRSMTDLICTYAPSQSAVVNHVASVAGGGAAAAAAVSKAAGLTAVAHSSGAYIFTGAGGYVAGTLGTAFTGPLVIGIGIVVGGSAVTVELLCAPKNHPGLVARVESAAQDFLNRAEANLATASRAAEPMITRAKITVIKAGNEAFDYASRKTVNVSETFKK